MFIYIKNLFTNFIKGILDKELEELGHQIHELETELEAHMIHNEALLERLKEDVIHDLLNDTYFIKDLSEEVLDEIDDMREIHNEISNLKHEIKNIQKV